MPAKSASTKPAVKRVSKTVTPRNRPAKPAKKSRPEKKAEGKVKVVRDSFTMPQSDYDMIAQLKQKTLKNGVHVKKSELLRAGLHALSKLSAAQLQKAVSGLEKIKTGRPKKS